MSHFENKHPSPDIFRMLSNSGSSKQKFFSPARFKHQKPQKAWSQGAVHSVSFAQMRAAKPSPSLPQYHPEVRSLCKANLECFWVYHLFTYTYLYNIWSKKKTADAHRCPTEDHTDPCNVITLDPWRSFSPWARRAHSASIEQNFNIQKGIVNSPCSLQIYRHFCQVVTPHMSVFNFEHYSFVKAPEGIHSIELLETMGNRAKGFVLSSIE